MVTPLQKCYDEIAIFKEELKKRDDQIEKLIENNTNLNKKVESLLYKPLKGAPSRGKVAKLVENYEKNIVKPIPKPRPAPRSKVAKLVENYEKNIVKPIPKPRTIKTTPIPKPRTIKTTPIPKPRTIKTTPIPKPRTIKTTPIPKPIPAPKAKVAKLVENYEKNIVKPIPKPRAKVASIVKEIPIPSDYMFIDEEKPEIIKSAFKKNSKEI